MKSKKYIFLATVILALVSEAKGQEMPPAAIWVGLPYSKFEETNFKEIGVAVEIDCNGKYLSRYAKTIGRYDKRCYQWKRSKYEPSLGQIYEASFCFVSHPRDEKLILSDDLSLALLGDD